MREITKIILHCSASNFGDAKLINDWHLYKGWDGIGYNYVVTNGYTSYSDYTHNTMTNIDGGIEVGRDITLTPAHCYGHNRHSIGVCLIGVKDFSDIQLSESIILVRKLMKEYNLKIEDIFGHCEFNDEKTCPNFDMNKYRNMLRIIENLAI